MDTSRNLAIIQARMGSSRLPNKVLLYLSGKTVLEQVVNRVRQCKLIDDIIVATTIEKQDLEIVKLCQEKGIQVICGSEDDVLDRYYQIAKLKKPKNVIRITADCPMIDPGVIDKVIAVHMNGEYDYTSNTLEETYPDGQDIEIMKYEILEQAWKEAKLSFEREHVTQYIIHNPNYKKHNVLADGYYGDKRWTLDNEEDYEFIKQIYKRLYQDSNCKCFTMEDILRVLKKEPEIERINTHIERNEGLKKSIKEECNNKCNL